MISENYGVASFKAVKRNSNVKNRYFDNSLVIFTYTDKIEYKP